MTPILQLKNIQFSVKNRTTPILDNLNLEIFAEEFVVIIGHNGSGKSSLLKILSGDMLPTAGNILLNGLPISEIPLYKKAKDFLTLTQIPENRLFVDLTVEENIILWESRFPTENRRSCEEILNTKNFSAKFINMLKNPVSTLSGGEKQALLLILTLIHPPQILYLDEHTSALDYKISNVIMNITATEVLDNKITTIMVTHNLEDALNYGNRIIVLNKGQIVFDYKQPSGISIKELKSIME